MIINCEQCKRDFESDRRSRKFCCRSCAAIRNNQKYPKRSSSEKRYCLQCRKQTKNQKFCSHACHKDYEWEKRKRRIEDGYQGFYYKMYKKYLIEKFGEACRNCGWCEVNPHSGNIPVELEHIDGNSSNNSLDNLTLLCPNCHSLTPTYGALNMGNGRHKRRERYAQGKSS